MCAILFARLLKISKNTLRSKFGKENANKEKNKQNIFPFWMNFKNLRFVVGLFSDVSSFLQMNQWHKIWNQSQFVFIRKYFLCYYRPFSNEVMNKCFGRMLPMVRGDSFPYITSFHNQSIELYDFYFFIWIVKMLQCVVLSFLLFTFQID